MSCDKVEPSLFALVEGIAFESSESGASEIVSLIKDLSSRDFGNESILSLSKLFLESLVLDGQTSEKGLQFDLLLIKQSIRGSKVIFESTTSFLNE